MEAKRPAVKLEDSPVGKKPRLDPAIQSPHSPANNFEEDLAMYQAFEEMDVPSSQEARWRRPPLPSIDPHTTPLIFQQLEIEHYLTEPMAGMPGPQHGTVPVVRMFGVSTTID